MGKHVWILYVRAAAVQNPRGSPIAVLLLVLQYEPITEATVAYIVFEGDGELISKQESVFMPDLSVPCHLHHFLP